MLKHTLKTLARRALSPVIGRFELGSYSFRATRGLIRKRPHYAYCLYQSALLAKKLGQKEISTIEFGVAGGRGLLALEDHASKIEKELSIGISVYGFDTGAGLPDAEDYRDLPHFWKKGAYVMDSSKLAKRLKKAKLVIGHVRDTVRTFDGPPIAAIMFDLDYYSSTRDALRIFDRPTLPRVFCYFDDIDGDAVALISEYTGVRLAINEFNDENTMRKIDKLYFPGPGFGRFARLRAYHSFAHPQYNTFIGNSHLELPL